MIRTKDVVREVRARIVDGKDNVVAVYTKAIVVAFAYLTWPIRSIFRGERLSSLSVRTPGLPIAVFEPGAQVRPCTGQAVMPNDAEMRMVRRRKIFVYSISSSASIGLYMLGWVKSL